MQTLITLVSWSYLVTNTVRIAFYAPQIRAVFLASDGARAVSLTTWAFWTVSNITSIAYGWVVLHDLSFTLIFAGNAVCTGVVTVIAARKRLAWRAAGSRRAVHAA